MAVIVDCSVAVAWCFLDEANELTGLLLRRARRESLCVPGIWPLEIANTLALAERKGRITPDERERFLEVLASLTIHVEGVDVGVALGETMRLARENRLTSYDAAYLECALRKTLPLATRDKELAAAAKRSGVELIPV